MPLNACLSAPPRKSPRGRRINRCLTNSLVDNQEPTNLTVGSVKQNLHPRIILVSQEPETYLALR